MWDLGKRQSGEWETGKEQEDVTAGGRGTEGGGGLCTRSPRSSEPAEATWGDDGARCHTEHGVTLSTDVRLVVGRCHARPQTPGVLACVLYFTFFSEFQDRRTLSA